MIFLSKNGLDEYINMFARGSRQPPTSTDEFVYAHGHDPIVLRGILKHKIMKQCWADKRTFYFMDTGYFGNEISRQNPNGHKIWHRIVKNNLQHTEIIERPDDRWLRHNRTITPWRRDGRKILVLPPGEKPAKFYGIDPAKWTEETVAKIKSYTDRPVEVRLKPSLRLDRVQSDTFAEALEKDVFATVVYNSIASIESILHGIPVFTMTPNAADPVANKELNQIETPYYADADKVYAWACHLAYGQFHVRELQNGTAMKILLEK